MPTRPVRLQVERRPAGSRRETRGSQQSRRTRGPSRPPASLMYGHMLDEANDFMIGYRYLHTGQSAQHAAWHRTPRATRRSSPTAAATRVHRDARQDGDEHAHAGPDVCATDWLTLMVMFQFMDMQMIMSPLEGADTGGGGHHHGGGHYDHTTAGIGDTALAALVKLVNSPATDLHAGLGRERADRGRRHQDDGRRVHALRDADRQRHLGSPAEPDLHWPSQPLVLGRTTERRHPRRRT